MRELPSLEYLRERLRLDHATGRLYWRRWEANGPGWNGRWADREAFTTPGRHGHLTGSLDGRAYRAARVVWAMERDAWPDPALEVKHRDGDITNNRHRNLYLQDRVTRARRHNRSPYNTSGVTGVSWDARLGRWRAQIGHEGTNHLIGVFVDKDDAIAARLQAEIDLGYPVLR